MESVSAAVSRCSLVLQEAFESLLPPEPVIGVAPLEWFKGDLGDDGSRVHLDGRDLAG